jgi:hypothetical protein
MNGGPASPAARRSATPEPAPRTRPAVVVAAPVRQLPPARVVGAEPAAVPTTRDRLEASFGTAVPAVVTAPDAPLSTRARIANRARAEERESLVAAEPASVIDAAPVVDLAEERERRRPATVTEPPRADGPMAPVIVLAPPPGPPARAPPPAAPRADDAPPRADPVAGDDLARAPPEAAAPPQAGAAPLGTATATLPEAAIAETAQPEAPAPDTGTAAPDTATAAEQAAAQTAPTPQAGGSRSPADDPAFQAMRARADASAGRAKDHQPATEGAATAQAASEPDVQKDVGSQAAGDQVGVMGDQEPGKFDPVAFKLAVKAAVVGMAPPKTLEEADEFEESGKAAGATAAIHGLVSSGKGDSERAIKTATETEPDPSGKTPKAVVKPMVNDAPGPPLPGVDAAAALPGLRPEADTDLSGGPLAIARNLAEAKVTEEQLAEGNEPAFDAALGATQEVRDHAATAPAGYREQEAVVLADGRTGAQQVAGAQLESMHGARGRALGGVLGTKDLTTGADRQLYDDAHQKILDIHTQTQADVTKLLGLLDSSVETLFTDGEKAARKTFEDDVARDMEAYKDDRYSGLRGKARWLKDRFFDLPKEVNKFYEAGRQRYLDAMDRVIETIAFTVGLLLGAAHLRIEIGRAEVDACVTGLPDSVKQLAKDTADDLDHQFDDLAGDVDAKRDELVDTVARLYVDSRDELDSRIKELQEANKGLVSKAIDAVIGVLKTIYELGKLLLRVLLKAASAIGDILAHPIRFLGYLVDGVKGGLDRFVGRIGVHLENAMLELLFGHLGKANISMPKQLDFAGILDLVLQVLGLRYEDIRERVVHQFGEEAVAGMEGAVDVFSKLHKEGLAGLWEWIREKLSDLEDLVIGKIKEYIVERVIRAGIGYIIALLNPAAAFIKACQGIYQIVMFVIERAREIATFVDSVLDSIGAIAQGNIGVAVTKVESALAGGLALAIGFLARLANLGGLADKMHSIIAAVRKPITRQVDRIVFGAATVYRKTIGRALAFGKAKVNAGREWAKGKVDAGKALARRKAEAVKLRLSPRQLATAPPAEHPQPAADEDLAQPIHVAEDSIEVAPEDRHVVFAQLGAGGQIDIGISSTPQLVTALVAHLESRIEGLPVAAPARPPKGGKKTDQPRSQAQAAAQRIGKLVGKLDLDFEHDFDARRALHRSMSFAGFARVYQPAPGLTSRLAKLGDSVQVLLRMFYAYDKPKFARGEDEPARGQKLSGRVWAAPDEKGKVLPDAGRRGLDPLRPGARVLAPDPHLVASTHGAVNVPGAERARGVLDEEKQTKKEKERKKGIKKPDVVVRSWAIGGTPDHGSNASHTETHFYHWLVAQGEDFHGRVTAIELRSGLSPCGSCTVLLEGIARLVRNRPPGSSAPTLIVFWDNVYGNDDGDVGPAAATFQRHVNQLGHAGWIVHGPTPGA